MYSFSGRHPNTGHEWHFFQGINFTYIPRTQRRHFANIWVSRMERNNGNFQLDWASLVSEFPYLRNAVRRYFYKPSYYIQDAMEVPLEDIEQVVVSTWSRDFSKKLRTNLVQKFRRARRNVSKGLRTGIFKR